ncbi:PDDEXK-like family protein [Campylobacter ureolyticus]|uniref:PD-(D/E)XK nuclease family protein n=1 Tax=Campylobacter ureolyticus TaxID=827 RepID=A0AAE7JQ96_9BACT|nr:PD-(D/E)XK nuclease family protein [Campylobacter ureolyticus]MCR8685034.1 PD-(D/E)XK nuclease family protein [Campylobacter ureolyticus]QKF84763.1 PD-(D/E)XK nuclease family protein [Campylobacter ureolyticus]QQY35070.1 PD-(D/E)XK nuclease family protein [Campylobacter ureolyticus]SUX21268.1 Ketopantoate hydroxymethyltransferase [Campylobacter ureolyticus]
MINFNKLIQDVSMAKKESELRKLRGVNDYNIFTELLDQNDEVRLHSGFIYSLLNPAGTHYQKSLFLKKFLEICDIRDFNYENAEVFKEYKHIDIYITDGNKHVILENKIYAGDQEAQIERYIKTIKIDKDANFKDIEVIYLSLDREFPSKYSLGNYKIKNNFLINNDEKIKLHIFTYKLEITKWLKECKNEVENLTNLNFYITEYEKVIKKLYGEYKMVSTDVRNIIKENYEIAKAIYQDFEQAEKEIVDEFTQKTYKIVKERLSDEFIIEYKKFNGRGGKDIMIIRKNDWKLYFCFEFDDSKQRFLCYGIGKDNKYENIDCRKIDFSGKNKNGFSVNKWWIACKWLGKNDNGQEENLANNIMLNNITPEYFSSILINMVNQYSDELDKLNKNINL